MQRIVLSTTAVVAVFLACGCGQSDPPTEDQTQPIESSAGEQTVNSSGSDAETPADESQTVTVQEEPQTTDGDQNSQIVEVGCAKCMFAMKGVDGHELAIMIDGKAYEVTGAYVDPTESGLCKTVKKAQVVGQLMQYGEGLSVDEQQGEFIAQSIELQE